MVMRCRGCIIRFFDKGFGFIRTEDAEAPRLYFHASDIIGDTKPITGDVVTYVLGKDSHGRPKAVEVARET